MKNSKQILMMLILITISILSCKKEEVEKTIYGNWEVESIVNFSESLKYVSINKNKSIDEMNQTALGFKYERSYISLITEDQIKFGYYSTFNYVLIGDKLFLTGLNDTRIVLKRNIAAPTKDTWIKEIKNINEGNLPWNSTGDLAFDGSHIIYGNSSMNKIAYINTNTLNMDVEESTLRYADAIAVEKSTSASRFIFQSSSSRFYGYEEDTNVEVFMSDIFPSSIKSMAVLDEDNIWVGAGNKLYIYKYTGLQSIIKTIELDSYISGITYYNNHLYMCSGKSIYKCETSPTFKVVETYKYKNNIDATIEGITFDGTNFWINYDLDAIGSSLIKIDVPL